MARDQADNRRLLLVEDNPGDARLTQLLLEEVESGGLGPLTWVDTAGAALAALRSPDEPFAAVLLDLGLPDRGGLALLTELVMEWPDLPVVVLTGNGDQSQGLDALGAGAQDYLEKSSLDARQLARAVAFATRRKELERALVSRALQDGLTGLPRRELLLDRLHYAVVQARRTGVPGAVLFVDLDGFKAVNDRHGHSAGDAVLRTVAQRLRANVRAIDTVARLGGDEFVVVLHGLSAIGAARAVAAKLLAAVERPVTWKGVAFAVSASIGVVGFDGSGRSGDAQELLARGDAAMYRAKVAGGRRVDVAE